MSDGGPAFPRIGYQTPREDWRSGQEGMSLRDYFAIHCDQPGQQEIITEAGVMVREYSGLKYEDEEYKKLPTWAQWWTSLSQAERFRLYSKVRYGIAILDFTYHGAYCFVSGPLTGIASAGFPCSIFTRPIL